MIKIEDHHQSSDGGKKYKIIFSSPGSGMRAYSVWAECIEEVHEALNHYYGAGPRAADHKSGAIEHCPLCRVTREGKFKRPGLRVV